MGECGGLGGRSKKCGSAVRIVEGAKRGVAYHGFGISQQINKCSGSECGHVAFNVWVLRAIAMHACMYFVHTIQWHHAGSPGHLPASPLSSYDIEDAIVMNKYSLDRGFGRCIVLKKYGVSLKKYANRTMDRIVAPVPLPGKTEEGNVPGV